MLLLLSVNPLMHLFFGLPFSIAHANSISSDHCHCHGCSQDLICIIDLVSISLNVTSVMLQMELPPDLVYGRGQLDDNSKAVFITI